MPSATWPRYQDAPLLSALQEGAETGHGHQGWGARQPHTSLPWVGQRGSCWRHCTALDGPPTSPHEAHGPPPMTMKWVMSHSWETAEAQNLPHMPDAPAPDPQGDEVPPGGGAGGHQEIRRRTPKPPTEPPQPTPPEPQAIRSRPPTHVGDAGSWQGPSPPLCLLPAHRVPPPTVPMAPPGLGLLRLTWGGLGHQVCPQQAGPTGHPSPKAMSPACSSDTARGLDSDPQSFVILLGSSPM